ncbi:hypothetical protein AB0Y02_04260 [Phocaeicola dorei]
MGLSFHPCGTPVSSMWDHHPTWVEHQMHPFEKPFSIGEKTETDALDK